MEIGNYLRTIASQIASFGQRVFSQIPDPGGANFPWFNSLGLNTWAFNTNGVNIADSGERIIRDIELLEITTDKPGTFYLRGYSMIRFNGRSWRESADSDRFQTEWHSISVPGDIAGYYNSVLSNSASGPRLIKYSINKTGDKTPGIRYRPYYYPSTVSLLHYTDNIYIDFVDPDDSNVFPHMPGMQNNDEFFLHVTGSVHDLLKELNDTVDFEFDFSYNRRDLDHFTDVYTEIDPDTAAGLRELALAAGINPNDDRYTIADAVAEYIRSSGTYTLTPSAFPRGEDYALYFLTESRQGYCIHFATVATLMLRSLDIPARFTVGYTVTVGNAMVDTPVIVTDRDAHAWVEVLYEDAGWLYLEVTPSAGSNNIPPPRPHVPETVLPTPIAPDLTPTPAPSPTPPANNTPAPSPGAPGNTNNDPSGTGSRPPPSSFDSFLRNTGIVIVCIAVFAVGLPLRRNLIIKRRTKQFNRINTNAAVLHIWRFIQKIYRPEYIIPENIEDLALKARFSQHRLTEEEREVMIRYAKMLSFDVYNELGTVGSLWHKYILGLY